MKTKKNLDYYLNLSYEVNVTPISKEDGGGYMAVLPQFGTMGIVGDGESVQEAIDSLNSIKKYIFKLCIEENRVIPEPNNTSKIVKFKDLDNIFLMKGNPSYMFINVEDSNVLENLFSKDYYKAVLNKFWKYGKLGIFMGVIVLPGIVQSNRAKLYWN